MENRLLGLCEPHPDVPRLRLAAYRQPASLVYPPRCDWTAGIRPEDWGMLANDRLGTCGIAGPLHQVLCWAQRARGLPLVFSDEQALAEYSAVSGYDPLTGAGDVGVVLSDVMTRWQQIGLAGHRIAGWTSGQVGHEAEVLWGCCCFGGAQLGLALPLTASDQLAAGQPWSLTSRWLRRGKPGSWGLHCVFLAGYDLAQGAALLVTWGRVQICTLEWLDYYLATVDYPVSEEWLEDSGVSPSGLKKQDLLEDLQVLAA